MNSDVRITHIDGSVTYQAPYDTVQVIEVQNTRRFAPGMGLKQGLAKTRGGKDAGSPHPVREGQTG